MAFVLIPSTTLSLNAAFTQFGGYPPAAYGLGEIYSDDYSKSKGVMTWHQDSSDGIYMYLQNYDEPWNRNTNAKVQLYSENSNGSYTHQTSAYKEDVSLWEKVELNSNKNWYSWDDFKGYYYYTWISGNAASLWSKGY